MIPPKDKLNDSINKLNDSINSKHSNRESYSQIQLNLYEDDFPLIFDFLKKSYINEHSAAEILMEQELKLQESPLLKMQTTKEYTRFDPKHLQILQKFTNEDLNKLICEVQTRVAVVGGLKLVKTDLGIEALNQQFFEIFQILLENNDLEACEQILLLGRLLAVDQTNFDQRLLELVCMKINTFMRNPKPSKDYLCQFIRFMIQLKAEELLYSQIYVTVQSFMDDEGMFFVECLSHFIENKQVTYIPERQLGMIQKLLIKKNKFPLLYKLIISLSNDNFLIPLFQFQTYFTQHHNMKEYNLCRQYSLISQAYILLCLQDIQPREAEQLFDFLFDKITLTQFMLVDAQSCFQILNKSFQLTTVHLIEFTHKKNLKLIIDIVEEIKDHNVEKYFLLFILNTLFSLKLQVSPDILSEIIKFLVCFPSTFFLIEPIIYFECIDKLTFTYLSKYQDQIEVLQFIHQTFVIQLLNMIDKDEMESLLKNIDISDVGLVSAHIETAKYRYEIAYSIYLKSSNLIIQNSVFEWLDTLFEKLPIMDLVVKQLNQLIKLDLEKTRIIIQKQQKDYESQIIDQLGKFPSLQLEYLDSIITLKRKQELVPSTQIMIHHILLISKLCPDRLVEELRYNDYPLEEVLRISIETDNLEAQAYVHERNGAIYDAIKIHIGILDSMFDTILLKTNEYEEVTIAQYNLVNVKINQIMQICTSNSQNDSTEDNWYAFLDAFIAYSKRLDKKDPKQTLVFQQVYKKLDSIFEQISLRTPLQIFVQALEERYGQIKIFELRHTFMRIIFNFYYQKNFIYNILSFLKDAQERDFDRVFEGHLRGYPIYESCDYCGLALNVDKSKSIVFYCGHQIHWHCNSDPLRQRCKKCQKEDLGIYENSISKQQRMRRLVDKEPTVARSYSIQKIENQDYLLAPFQDIQKDRKERLLQFDSNRSAHLSYTQELTKKQKNDMKSSQGNTKTKIK